MKKPLTWTDEEMGSRIVNIALSLNKYVKMNTDMDVDCTTYSSIQPSLDSPDSILKEIESIRHDLPVSLDDYPKKWITGSLKAYESYARYLSGDSMDYETLQRDIQQLPCQMISDQKLLDLRSKLDVDLGQKGLKGSLNTKIQSWLESHKIPPRKLSNTAKKLLKQAKTETLERIVNLPEYDEIEAVNTVKGVFWSGLSVYTGQGKGNITFNEERLWAEPVFRQVLTHEGYPGHQTFYCRWDWLFQQGEFPLEASYYIINAPNNSLFEGAPENGLNFLGWNDYEVDTPGLTLEYKKELNLILEFLDLQRSVQTNACYLTNIHSEPKEQVIDYMMEIGGFDELQATNTWRYFTHPIQKIYYPSYYHGKKIIGEAFNLIEIGQRKDFFRHLYDHPHTNETFIDLIINMTGKDFHPFD